MFGRSILVLVALLFAFSGGEARTLDEIIKDGTIRVGVNPNFPPMSSFGMTNQLEGFDVDMGRLIAEKLGVEVEFVPTDWKTLVNGVVAGKYHMTGSASISPPRMKVAGFSES